MTGILFLVALGESHRSRQTEFVTPVLTSFSDSSLDTRNFHFNEKLKQFKLDLHRSLESSRLRRKRENGSFINLSYRNVKEQEMMIRPILSGSENFQSIMKDSVSCWTSITYGQKDYFLIITFNMELILFNFDGNVFEVLLHLNVEHQAYKAKAFVHNHQMWFIVSYEAENGVYTQMYSYNGQYMFKKQKIHFSGFAYLELLLHRGVWYLGAGVASEDGHVFLYEWRNTQFDLIAEAESYGIQAVALWEFGGIIYIATARSDGLRNEGSLIYSYHSRNGKKLMLFQQLEEIFATNLLHYAVGNNHYLLFLTDSYAVIYWWTGEEFLFYQSLLETANAVFADALLLPNGEVAIVIAQEKAVLIWTEDYTSEYINTYNLNILDGSLIKSAGFFSHGFENYFLFLTFQPSSFKESLNKHQPRPNIWKLNVTPGFRRAARLEKLSSCLMGLEENIASQMRELQSVGDKMDKIWFSDREQTVTTSIIIKGNMETTASVSASKVLLSSLEAEISKETNSGLRLGILKERAFAESVGNETQNIVYKSQDQHIDGPLNFLIQPVIKKGELKYINKNVFLNGINTSRLDAALLTNGIHQVFTADVSISGLDTDHISIDGKLDKIDFNDLFKLYEPTVVKGTVLFHNISVQELNIPPTGTINSIEPRSMVLSNNSETIHGIKVFTKLLAKKQIIVRGTSNGNDLSEFVKKIVSTKENNVEVSEIEIAAPLVINGNLHISGLLNGYLNFSRLASDAITLNKDQKIGYKTFKMPVNVNRDVNVIGLTNGIDVDKDLFTLDTPQIIPHKMTFLKMVNFGGDVDTLTINELDLSEEAVTSMGPQIITGHKRFTESVSILGDVTLAPNSLINSVNIANLGHLIATEENFTLNGLITFKNGVTAKHVDFISEVNGMSANDFRHDFWRKSLYQEIPVPLVLNSTVTFKRDVRVQKYVNGFNLDTDFIHTTGDEFIDGMLSFSKDVHVDQPLFLEDGVHINNYNVKLYGELIINPGSSAQIFGSKIFTNLEVLGNVIVNGSVNDIPSTDKILFTKQPQEVKGLINFKSPVTTVLGNCLVDDVYLKNDINGIHFSRFADVVVLKNDSRNIPIENKIFSFPLKVRNLNTLGMLDGIDITDLQKRAIPVKSLWSQYAAYNFTEVSFSGDIFLSNFNGRPVTHYTKRAVFHNETVIKGTKTILGSVEVQGNVIFNGNLNGIDLHKLVTEGVSHSSNNFSSPVTVSGDLFVATIWVSDSSAISGVPWSDIALLEREEHFMGNNIFLQDVIVEREVTVEGALNQCLMKQVPDLVIYTNKENQFVENLISIGRLVVYGNVTALNGINEINVNQLAAEMVVRSGPQKLSGDFVFKSGIFAKKLILKNVVNAVNLSYILHDSVSKHLPQDISGMKTFTYLTGLTVAGDLTVAGNISMTYLDGLDITRLHETTVLSFVNQTIGGRKNFTNVFVSGNVYVQGHLNGINFPSEVILTKSSEELPVEINVVGETIIHGSLIVENIADGVNLNYVIAERVSLSHEETISAELTFLEDVRAEVVWITGFVNNILASTIVTRSRDYVINGLKHIKGQVTVEGDFQGCCINNLSITDLADQIVRIDREEVVSGPVIFVAPLEVSRNIIVEGSINDLNLKAMQNNLSAYETKLASLSHSVILATDSQQIILNDLMQTYETCSFSLFAYFDVVQVLEVPAVKIFSSPISLTHNFDESIPSTNLFAWSPRVCGDLDYCCPLSTIIIAFNEHGYATIIDEPREWRLFPFVFGKVPEPNKALQGFLLWTNSTTSSQDCDTGLAEETVISSLVGHVPDYYSPGILESAFVIKQSAYIQDVNLFEIQGQLYMIIAYSYDKYRELHGRIEVYSYRKEKNEWLAYQTITAIGVSDIDLLELDYGEVGQINCILLAVACKPPGVSQIYTWIIEYGKFELLSSLPSSWPSSVAWVTVHDSVYAVFANEKSIIDLGVPVFTEPVVVFLYDHMNKRMQLWQNIPIYGVVSLATFELGGETYILGGSAHHQLVYVIQWKGYSGFEVIQEFPVPGIRHLHVFWSINNELRLAVSSVCGTMILKGVTEGLGLSNWEIAQH